MSDERDKDAGLIKSKKETLSEKAQRPVTVHGHAMSAADVYKFIGLIVFFVLMAALCVLLWPYISEITEPGGVNRLIERVQNAGVMGVFILLAIQFLQVVVAFIPGEVVQVAAGMIYGPWLGALIVLLGCVISSAFVFVLVKKLGAPFVQKMVPEKYMDKFQRFEASGKLNIAVFVLFFIPGLPKDVFTYLVPLTHMRIETFLLLSNVGRIPGVVMSTYAAGSIVEGDYLVAIIIFIISAVIAGLGLFNQKRIMAFFEKRRNGKD